MQITRKSNLSGIVRTRDLDITAEQWERYVNGALIQVAFPHLSSEDREFIIGGLTQEEWDEVFGPEE